MEAWKGGSGGATEASDRSSWPRLLPRHRRWRVRLRVTWTLLSIFAVECLVFGLAMLPAALFWEIFSLSSYPFVLLRIIVLSMAFVPAYGLFAFSLMVLSALPRAGSDGELRQTPQCRSGRWNGRS